MERNNTAWKTGRIGLAVLALLLVPPLTTTEAAAQSFRVDPDPIVMIIWDRSSSMDFTVDWRIPNGVDCNDSCDPTYINNGQCDDGRAGASSSDCVRGTDCTDCAGPDLSLCDAATTDRTRNLEAREVFTGSYIDYCAVLHDRPYSPDGRDRPWGDDPTLSTMQEGLRGALWPHTEPSTTTVQRRDGLLDRYADQVFFGFATWDVDFNPGSDFAGDYSYPEGLGYDQRDDNTFGWDANANPNAGNGNNNNNNGNNNYCTADNWSLDNGNCYIDMGLANRFDPVGGMVNPMPIGGFPSVPGGAHAIRLGLNLAVQDRINGIVPAGSSPISSAIQDLVWFQYFDSTTTSEPYAQCRPVYFLFITDGPNWDSVWTDGIADPSFPSYEPANLGVIDCVGGCDADRPCPNNFVCESQGGSSFCVIPAGTNACHCEAVSSNAGDICAGDSFCEGGLCDDCYALPSDYEPCLSSGGAGGANEVDGFIENETLFSNLQPWEVDPEDWFSAGLWHVLTNQRYWKPDIELRWSSGLGQGGLSPLHTYFIGFGTHDEEYVHTLAAEANSCQLGQVDVHGNQVDDCAYVPQSGTELRQVMAQILNFFEAQAIGGGRISLIPPLVHTTLDFDLEAGTSSMALHRFRASSTIDPTNATFWRGELTRETWTCQEGLLTLDTDLSMDLHEQFTAERVSQSVCAVSGESCDPLIEPRNILVGRPDLVGRACGETYGFNRNDGAVASPTLDGSYTSFGDGTGGRDSGGAQTPLTAPIVVADSGDEVVPVTQCSVDEEMSLCLLECGGSATCLCECQRAFDCGACTYAGGEACVDAGYGNCVFGCNNNILCIASCQRIFDCGTANSNTGETEPSPVEADCTDCSRADIDARLLTERLGHGAFGNDDELPEFPGFNFEALDDDGDCALELTTDVFAGSDDELWAMLYAETQAEAAGIVNFTRGAHLADLEALSQLPEGYDPMISDRDGYGYIPGALLNSNPALILPPIAVERRSPGWIDFVSAYGVGGTNARRDTLVIGGNDAQVHAFDVLTGEEIWSFIPPSFLPQLHDLMLGHRATVNGDVVVKNVRCKFDELTEEWCTLLAVSYRSGGSGVTVLDVTDVNNPKFLFEVTGRDIPELGLSHPRPILGNMQVLTPDHEGEERAIERPVLIVGGGRPLAGSEIVFGGTVYGSHEGELLVIMDALTGQIYRQFDPITNPYEFSTCGPITSGVAPWPQHIISRAYMGTQYGCLLRADLSHSDPANWSFEILHRASHLGEISHTPSVAPGGQSQLVVMYGTGNLDWAFDHATQEGSLVSITENIVATSATDVSYAAFAFDGVTVNYEMLFDVGEFITSPPVIYNGNAYFATYVPNRVDVCNQGGSRIYGIDYVGDPSVEGGLVDSDGNNLEPHIVTVDSDRIVGVFENPLAGQVDQPAYVKRIGEARIGYGNVAFNVSLQIVPDCSSSALVQIDGQTVSISGASTQRRLQIDFLQQPDAQNPQQFESATSSMADATDAADASTGGYGVLTLEHDVSAHVTVGFELDWGPVLGQSHTFGYRGF